MRQGMPRQLRRFGRVTFSFLRGDRGDLVFYTISAVCLILVPLYSVLSVYSVVLVDNITTEYTENMEKTLKKKANMSDCTASHLPSIT
jgi:hypothetical protein